MSSEDFKKQKRGNKRGPPLLITEKKHLTPPHTKRGRGEMSKETREREGKEVGGTSPQGGAICGTYIGGKLQTPDPPGAIRIKLEISL